MLDTIESPAELEDLIDKYDKKHHNNKIFFNSKEKYQKEFKEIINFQDLVRKVPVAENVIKFAVEIVNSTRPTNNSSPEFIKHWISWGAGPRASQYLLLAAKTRAITQGRFTPNIDDIKSAMIPVLRHRIITNFNAEAEGISSIEVIKKLLVG